MLRFGVPYYQVDEATGFVEVCIVPQENTGLVFARSASLNISTADITATG